MIRITWAAQNQVDDLLCFYLDEKERPETARRLRQDLAQARRRIIADPTGGLMHPRPDRNQELVRFGFRWLFVRAYWVSWIVIDGVPVITNVLHASADINRRATPTTDIMGEW